jgi:O-antigen/teichoic acid export membrane protein
MELKKIKDLVSLGSGDIFGSVLSAIFWFYLATQIEPSEYGEIHWFIGIASIFSYIATVGTVNTITVYTAKGVKIQSTLYAISLLASLVLSLIVIVVFPAFYEIDVSVLMIAYVINALAIGNLLGTKSFTQYSKYVFVQKGLTLVLGLGFLYLFGYESILFALGLSYVFYIKRIINVFKEIKIDFRIIKGKIGFVTNNYVMFVVGGLSGQIDKIIIAPLLGFTLLGNYSLALQAIGIMMIISSVSYKYLLPQDATNTKNKNFKIWVIIVSTIITLIGIFIGPYLIENYFTGYIDSKIAIQVMSIAVIPGTVSLILQSEFLGNEKSKIVLIGNLSSLIVLTIGMIILGLNFGIFGLGVSLVIANMSKMLIFLVFRNLLRQNHAKN